MKLTVLEIGIFTVYLITTIAIGFFAGRKGNKSTSDYFLAGRKLPWYAVGFSLIATSISTEQFIGEVGWGYQYGMAVANWEWLCWPAQALLLFFFLPLYLKSKIYTVPEYLMKRFGNLAGTAFSLVCIVMYMIVNLPLVLYSGGFVLEKIFGVNIILAIWILAISTGAYAIYGGLSSVVWTDFFQGLLLIAGGLLVFFLGVHAVPGGLPAIIGTGERAHLMPSANHPMLPWTGIIAMAFVTSGFYYSSNQYITQRCLGAKTEWDGKMGVVLAVFLGIPLGLCVTWPGMIAYAINPNLEQCDAAYPFLIATVVPKVLRGIIFAGLTAAIMSTISSLYNSTASLVTLDIYKRLINRSASDRHLVRFAQIFGIVFLITSTLWAPVVGKFKSIFDYVQSCWALMMAPCMAVFILAIFWKRATYAAAVVTLVSSLPMLLIVFLRQFYGILGKINIFNLSGIIFIISLFLMVIVSLITKPPEPEQLKTTIWKPQMLKLPEEELKRGYPFWKWIGLWFAAVVAIFVVIYAKFW